MINNCDVLSNTAVIAGGGIYNQEPKLDVVESRVSYNQTTANGSAGGGMYLKWSNATVTRSTISYNSSVDNGGGVFIDSNSKLAVILDSTISHNSTARGGGLYSIGGEIVVGNSTISNNYATSRGGGVYTDNSFPAEVTIEFFSVTIYSNRVGSIDGSAGDGGGLYNVDSSISMKNGILAGNNRGRLFPIDDDCYGVLESQDYNLIEETEGCTITGSTTHDQTGVNPMLDFLVDNGGPTRTRMPQPGSPVIDKGNPAGCTDTDGAMLATDQRGYARTVDGDGVGGAICDIGAVEFALNPVPTLTSLNPDSTQAGGGDFILTVNGSEFVDGAVVQWKGADRATIFISETQLSAQINAADIASQGSASITVLNPEPGGGVSNALTFSITAPAGGGYKIYLPIVDR